MSVLACCSLQLPGYFSWSEMSRNQLAADLPPGTKLFHPDQEGETVPINDPDIDAVSAC